MFSCFHLKKVSNYDLTFFQSLTGGAILSELGVEAEVAGERGLRLLLVLAFVYPSHFIYSDILKELLSLLGVAGDNIGPLVLSIFTFIGRKKPIGERNLGFKCFTGYLKFQRLHSFIQVRFTLNECSLNLMYSQTYS
jgi:hypothetical protein